MNIKQGEIFKNSTDGVDFTARRVVRDKVILESQDEKRQILTGVHTLTSTSSYMKKGGEKSLNKTSDTPFRRPTFKQWCLVCRFHNIRRSTNQISDEAASQPCNRKGLISI